MYYHATGEDLVSIWLQVVNLGAQLNMNVVAVEYPGYGENFKRGVTTMEEMIEESDIVFSYVTS